MNSEESNPTRQLRLELGMTQQSFASELGISLASVQNYERGSRPSDQTVEKMKDLALKHGYRNRALSFDIQGLGVRAIFEPGDEKKGRIRLPRRGTGVDMSDELHRVLENILNKGTPEIVATVEVLLRLADGHLVKSGGRR